MTLELTHDAATQVWDELALRLDKFIDAWSSGAPPFIDSYLPEEPGALRRLVLVELVKIDMEQRSTCRMLRTLEEYAADYPELLDNGEPPCELIYEEYHVRRTSGDSVAPREYYERFPRSSEALKRLLGADDLSATTQLRGTKKIEGIQAGQRLDDFDLIFELGKGAFGSVFLARQLSMQRLVALKISADKGNEPQTLANLDHPNIVRVYDQRTLDNPRMRVLYMQFAPGGTLQEVVARVKETPLVSRTGAILAKAVSAAAERSGTAMADDSSQKRRLHASSWPDAVCRVGIQLAQALDYAHRQGILHRDVKPANILLSADGSPKLADFNISFCSQLDGATPAAYFGGSVAYMSPEQLEACNPSHSREPKDLDGRSDLFGLAVVLWELLHGERPFQDAQLAAGWTATLVEMTRRRHETAPVRPVGCASDPLTRRMEQVLRRAMSPNVDDRHKNGVELARELMLCLNPSAWDLLKSSGYSWQAMFRRSPRLSLIPLNIIPFILAAIFNWQFNFEQIIEHLGAEQKKDFFFLSGVINGTLFPLATFIVISYIGPVGEAVYAMLRGKPLSEKTYALARRRVFRVGHSIALVGIACWVFAGVAFPIGLRLMGTELNVRDMLCFLLSQTICGLVSVGFPFLVSTWVAVRVYYPALLGNTLPTDEENRRLLALPVHASISYASAALVPIGALFMVIVTKMLTDETGRTTSAVFIAASGFGFVVSWFLYNRILRDVAAITAGTRGVESFGTVTDSSDGF